MPSNSTDHVKVYRKRLYENEDAYEEAKKKDKEKNIWSVCKLHDSIKQRKKNSFYQTAWRVKKAKAQAVIGSPPCIYPYLQTLGKTVCRAMKTMLKSPTKAAAVVDCMLNVTNKESFTAVETLKR